MQLRLSLDSEPLRVSMDTALMEQVLINVVKNACESSAAGSEVEVAVTARPASLMVTDHGKGISAQEEEQLFTPFHSTKPTGQGIGLMLVQEVLSRNGFPYTLHTEDDGATVFRIDFR